MNGGSENADVEFSTKRSGDGRRGVSNLLGGTQILGYDVVVVAEMVVDFVFVVIVLRVRRSRSFNKTLAKNVVVFVVAVVVVVFGVDMTGVGAVSKAS